MLKKVTKTAYARDNTHGDYTVESSAAQYSTIRDRLLSIPILGDRIKKGEIQDKDNSKPLSLDFLTEEATTEEELKAKYQEFVRVLKIL
jgi:hypothetical protein